MGKLSGQGQLVVGVMVRDRVEVNPISWRRVSFEATYVHLVPNFPGCILSRYSHVCSSLGLLDAKVSAILRENGKDQKDTLAEPASPGVLFLGELVMFTVTPLQSGVALPLLNVVAWGFEPFQVILE